MTDTDRMLVWLREALDAAQHDAEAVQPDSRLSPRDPVEFLLAGQDVTTPATEAAERHIRRHTPTAVLRHVERPVRLHELALTPAAGRPAQRCAPPERPPSDL